jgi:hypothetical protein
LKAGKEAAMNDAGYPFADRWHPADYRQEEIQDLRRAIRAKENRLVLGLPGMGLSNLLRFLVTRTDWGDRNVTFAYLDCDTLDNYLDYDEFFGEIAHEFYKKHPRNELKADIRGYERLKRYVLKAPISRLDRLVVVADEIDRMLATADSGFYRKLKALTDLNKGVCYIFAVTPNKANEVDPEDLLFAGRRLSVGPLNKRDIVVAIREEGQRLQRGFSLTEGEQLANLTGGHSGLLRSVSSAVIEEGLDLSQPEAILLERLLARADVQSRCRRIWEALDSAQRATLHAIGHAQPASPAQDILSWLHVFGLINEHQGQWRPFSPVFAGFVLRQQTDESFIEPISIVGSSTISANGMEIVVAGKVFKGDQEIYVTPLELRLIACLRRERRIYTKQEIAEYVFFKQQGVVDDQRIEDLVRRVRKKLGAQYIKTYWGKGYKILG